MVNNAASVATVDLTASVFTLPSMDFASILQNIGLKDIAVQHMLNQYGDLETLESEMYEHRDDRPAFALTVKTIVEPKVFVAHNVTKVLTLFDWFHYYND